MGQAFGIDTHDNDKWRNADIFSILDEGYISKMNSLNNVRSTRENNERTRLSNSTTSKIAVKEDIESLCKNLPSKVYIEAVQDFLTRIHIAHYEKPTTSATNMFIDKSKRNKTELPLRSPKGFVPETHASKSRLHALGVIWHNELKIHNSSEKNITACIKNITESETELITGIAIMNAMIQTYKTFEDYSNGDKYPICEVLYTWYNNLLTHYHSKRLSRKGHMELAMMLVTSNLVHVTLLQHNSDMIMELLLLLEKMKYSKLMNISVLPECLMPLWNRQEQMCLMYGKLGLKDTVFDKFIPTQDSPIIKVVASSTHALILLKAGFVYVLDLIGKEGEESNKDHLGLGSDITSIDITSPVLIPMDYMIKSIAVADNVSFFLTMNGKLLYCGMGITGTYVDTPQIFPGSQVYEPISLIAASYRNFIACNNVTHQVLVLGANDCHQLGFQSQNHAYPNVTFTVSTFHTNIEQFAVGHDFYYILSSDKQLYSMGGSTLKVPVHGQNQNCNFSSPQIVEYFSQQSLLIKTVTCGADHVLAITTEDRLFAWGMNSNGQLGINNQVAAANTPVEVTETFTTGFVSLKPSFIAANEKTSVVVTNKGDVYSMGKYIAITKSSLASDEDEKSILPIECPIHLVRKAKACAINNSHIFFVCAQKDVKESTEDNDDNHNNNEDMHRREHLPQPSLLWRGDGILSHPNFKLSSIIKNKSHNYNLPVSKLQVMLLAVFSSSHEEIGLSHSGLSNLTEMVTSTFTKLEEMKVEEGIEQPCDEWFELASTLLFLVRLLKTILSKLVSGNYALEFDDKTDNDEKNSDDITNNDNDKEESPIKKDIKTKSKKNSKKKNSRARSVTPPLNPKKNEKKLFKGKGLLDLLLIILTATNKHKIQHDEHILDEFSLSFYSEIENECVSLVQNSLPLLFPTSKHKYSILSRCFNDHHNPLPLRLQEVLLSPQNGFLQCRTSGSLLPFAVVDVPPAQVRADPTPKRPPGRAGTPEHIEWTAKKDAIQVKFLAEKKCAEDLALKQTTDLSDLFPKSLDRLTYLLDKLITYNVQEELSTMQDISAMKDTPSVFILFQTELQSRFLALLTDVTLEKKNLDRVNKAGKIVQKKNQMDCKEEKEAKEEKLHVTEKCFYETFTAFVKYAETLVNSCKKIASNMQHLSFEVSRKHIQNSMISVALVPLLAGSVALMDFRQSVNIFSPSFNLTLSEILRFMDPLCIQAESLLKVSEDKDKGNNKGDNEELKKIDEPFVHTQTMPTMSGLSSFGNTVSRSNMNKSRIQMDAAHRDYEMKKKSIVNKVKRVVASDLTISSCKKIVHLTQIIAHANTRSLQLSLHNNLNQKVECSKLLNQWLQTDLMKSGVYDIEGYRAEDLESVLEDDAYTLPQMTNIDEKTPSLLLQRRLSEASQKAVITEEDIQQFCKDFIELDSYASDFYDWLEIRKVEKLKRKISKRKEHPLVQKSIRAKFVAVLYHHGLIIEAIVYAKLVSKQEHRKDWHPFLPEIDLAWIESNKLKDDLMKQRRKLQETGLSLDDAWIKVCEEAISKGYFLLSIAPTLETVNSIDADPDSSSLSSNNNNNKPRSGKVLWDKLRVMLKVIRHLRASSIPSFLESAQNRLRDTSRYRQCNLFFKPSTEWTLNELQDEMENRRKVARERVFLFEKAKRYLFDYSSRTIKNELLELIRTLLTTEHYVHHIVGSSYVLLDFLQNIIKSILMFSVSMIKSDIIDLETRILCCGVLGLDLSDDIYTSHDGNMIKQAEIFQSLAHVLSKAGTSTDYIFMFTILDGQDKDVQYRPSKSTDISYKNKSLHEICWKVFCYLLLHSSEHFDDHIYHDGVNIIQNELIRVSKCLTECVTTDDDKARIHEYLLAKQASIDNAQAEKQNNNNNTENNSPSWDEIEINDNDNQGFNFKQTKQKTPRKVFNKKNKNNNNNINNDNRNNLLTVQKSLMTSILSNSNKYCIMSFFNRYIDHMLHTLKESLYMHGTQKCMATKQWLNLFVTLLRDHPMISDTCENKEFEMLILGPSLSSNSRCNILHIIGNICLDITPKEADEWFPKILINNHENKTVVKEENKNGNNLISHFYTRAAHLTWPYCAPPSLDRFTESNYNMACAFFDYYFSSILSVKDDNTSWVENVIYLITESLECLEDIVNDDTKAISLQAGKILVSLEVLQYISHALCLKILPLLIKSFNVLFPIQHDIKSTTIAVIPKQTVYSIFISRSMTLIMDRLSSSFSHISSLKIILDEDKNTNILQNILYLASLPLPLPATEGTVTAGMLYNEYDRVWKILLSENYDIYNNNTKSMKVVEEEEEGKEENKENELFSDVRILNPEQIVIDNCYETGIVTDNMRIWTNHDYILPGPFHSELYNSSFIRTSTDHKHNNSESIYIKLKIHQPCVINILHSEDSMPDVCPHTNWSNNGFQKLDYSYIVKKESEIKDENKERTNFVAFQPSQMTCYRSSSIVNPGEYSIKAPALNDGYLIIIHSLDTMLNIRKDSIKEFIQNGYVGFTPTDKHWKQLEYPSVSNLTQFRNHAAKDYCNFFGDNKSVSVNMNLNHYNTDILTCINIARTYKTARDSIICIIKLCMNTLDEQIDKNNIINCVINKNNVAILTRIIQLICCRDQGNSFRPSGISLSEDDRDMFEIVRWILNHEINANKEIKIFPLRDNLMKFALQTFYKATCGEGMVENAIMWGYTQLEASSDSKFNLLTFPSQSAINICNKFIGSSFAIITECRVEFAYSLIHLLINTMNTDYILSIDDFKIFIKCFHTLNTSLRSCIVTIIASMLNKLSKILLYNDFKLYLDVVNELNIKESTRILLAKNQCQTVVSPETSAIIELGTLLCTLNTCNNNNNNDDDYKLSLTSVSFESIELNWFGKAKVHNNINKDNNHNIEFILSMSTPIIKDNITTYNDYIQVYKGYSYSWSSIDNNEITFQPETTYKFRLSYSTSSNNNYNDDFEVLTPFHYGWDDEFGQLHPRGAMLMNNDLTTTRTVRVLAEAWEHAASHCATVGKVGWRTGVHEWYHHIDHQHSGVCYVGVTMKSANMTGNPPTGINNNACIFNSFETRNNIHKKYTVQMDNKDIIRIRIDCEAKTMQCWKNGTDFGIYKQKLPDLPTETDKYYPVYWMREPDDGCSFVYPSIESVDTIFNTASDLVHFIRMIKNNNTASNNNNIHDNKEVKKCSFTPSKRTISQAYSQFLRLSNRTFYASLNNDGTLNRNNVVVDDSGREYMNKAKKWTYFEYYSSICENIKWTREMDASLVLLVNIISKDIKIIPNNITMMHFITSSKSHLSSPVFREIGKIDVLDLCARFTLLLSFNLNIKLMLPKLSLISSEKISLTKQSNTIDDNDVIFKDGIASQLRTLLINYSAEADWDVSLQAEDTCELGVRNYIFTNIKEEFFNSILKETITHSRPPDRDIMELPDEMINFTVNRVGAHSAMEEIITDLEKSQDNVLYNSLSCTVHNNKGTNRNRNGNYMHLKYRSVFHQAQKSLFTQNISSLRREYIKPPLWPPYDTQIRTFIVKLKGENAMDLGGPYRAVFSDWVDEIFSPLVKLFVPSPNQNEKTTIFNNSYVFNDNHNQTDYINFGMILGMAIRCKIPLDFHLSSLFWKSLVELPRGLKDLKQIDIRTVRLLRTVRELHVQQNDNDSNTLDAILEEFAINNFTCQLSTGTVKNLVKDGKNLKISSNNYQQWTQLCVQHRLDEGEKQMCWIKEGISKIIPLTVFSLMTAREAETLICGEPYVDVKFLKENVTYESIDPASSSVIYFWETMNELSETEKSQFLMFCRGASRLNTNDCLNIASLTQQTRNPFPQARTCFFQLQLGEYDSKEIFKEKFMTAIYCNTMDLD